MTEGSRAIISGTTFDGNAGHLAGSIMITSGALATIENNVFTNNLTPNYGDFGGAIFHDSCDQDSRTGGDRSYIRSNKFVKNSSAGFGGAIRLGSPDGGCPKTVISNNVFTGNTAKIIGGAIHVTYCHGVQPQWSQNTFSNNIGWQFPGQLAFNPLRQAKGQGNPGAWMDGGCPQPGVTSNTFSTNSGSSGQARQATNPEFAAPWYFP